MNFNTNQQRLKHGESVFDALLHLGGKATFSELVKRIAESVKKPENDVESDVKHVLRAAVMNGYLIRHGRHYLVSRSCRTMCTDSRNRKVGSSTSGTNEDDVKESSFTTFGFPLWWNRFWNRFVVSKERNEMRCDRNTDENLTNESTEESDTTANTIAKTDSSVSVNKSEENVSDHCVTDSVHETEQNQSSEEEEVTAVNLFGSISTDSKPTTVRNDKDIRDEISNHSNESVGGSDFFWINDESTDDSWMD